MKFTPSETFLIGQRKLLQMQPSWTERALFLGTTGSGKTTLARYLLAKRPFVVIHDGKGCIDWRGYHKVNSLERMMRLDPQEYPKILYQPPITELNMQDTNTFFKWIFERKRTTVYVDEVMMCMHNLQVPDYYRACVHQGRQKEIEVWNSTQRPYSIPIGLLTESENFFLFRLVGDRDVPRAASITGASDQSLRLLHKHEFLYVKQGEPAQGPYKLKLNA